MSFSGSCICQAFALEQAFANLIMPVKGFLISLLLFRIGIHLLQETLKLSPLRQRSCIKCDVCVCQLFAEDCWLTLACKHLAFSANTIRLLLWEGNMHFTCRGFGFDCSTGNAGKEVWQQIRNVQEARQKCTSSARGGSFSRMNSATLALLYTAAACRAPPKAALSGSVGKRSGSWNESAMICRHRGFLEPPPTMRSSLAVTPKL